MEKQTPNILLQQSIINNIKAKKKKIQSLLNQIFNPYIHADNQASLIEEVNYEIDSLSIYITSLTNYDLSMTIQEKRDTDKIFDMLSLILNISIVLVFIFSVLLSTFIIINFKKLHFALQGDVLEKTEALKRLNVSLEKKIKKRWRIQERKIHLCFNKHDLQVWEK